MATQAPITIIDANSINVDTSGTLLDNGDTRTTVGIGGPDGAAALAPVSATAGLKVDLGTDNDVTVTTLPADPLGANADAAATAGSTGSLSAKMRLMTTQLAAIQTSLDALDNTVAGSELQVDIVGGGLTPARASSSARTSVSASLTSVTLKAANANRLALEVRNDSTDTMYVEYGATATTTSTKKLWSGEVFREELYTGVVNAIWDGTNGAARVLELTA